MSMLIVRVRFKASMARLRASTSTMVSGAMGEAHVIAARGGQPTSRTGKSRPRVLTIAVTAGAICCTKKSNAMKMPAKPTPSRRAEYRDCPTFMRMARATTRMTVGSIT